MARIPLMNTQANNVSVPDLAQGPSIAKAGQTWDAVARVGAIAADIGNDLLAKRKEAEIKSYTVSSKADIERRVTEYQSQLDSEFQGKDPTGYSAKMNEFLNDIGTEILDNAPSEDARTHFSTVFSEISNNIGMNAANQENKNRAYYQSNLLEQSSMKDRQLLISNPNSEKAAAFYANTLEGINGGIGLFWDKAQADQMVKNQAASYGQSYLEGALQNKRYHEVVRFADGKDPNGKVLLDQMDPTMLQKYKGEALRKMESEAEFSKVILTKNIQDVTAAVYTGTEIPVETISALKGKISQLKPEEAAYAMDDLNVALAYGDKLRQAKSMKVSEISNARAFMLDHGDDTFNLHGRLAAQKKFENGLKTIIDQKVNNLPQFLTNTDNDFKLLSKQALDLNAPDSMREWADTVLAKQKQEGAPVTKVLTPEMSKSYSAMLKSKNIDAVNQVRDALANGYGSEHFGKVVGDMVSNKDITEDMAMALYVPQPDLRKKMFENIQAKAQIEQDWGTRASKEAKSVMKEMFEDSEVANLKGAIRAGSKGNSRLWLNNSIDSAMELHFKAGIKNGLTPKEAKAEAMSIITGSFTAASAGKSQVIVPKQFEAFKSNIEDFMDQSLTTPALNSMDINVPREYLDSPLMIGKDTNEIKSKYLEDLAKQGRWISNNNQTGAVLTKVNPDGSTAPVRDSKGNIIERSFTDMRDNGLRFDEEIASYQARIESLREEAKTSVSAAGQIAMAQYNINRLKREQRKRTF